MRLRFLLVFACFCVNYGLFSNNDGHVKNARALIFDAGIHPAELYQHSMDLLKKLGWAVTYRSLEDSLALGLEAVFKPQPLLSIFIINEECLRSGKASVVGQFVKSALAKSAALPGGTTVIMLPQLGASQVRSVRKANAVFKALGLRSLLKGPEDSMDDFQKAMMRFLTNPFASRKFGYHTSLRLPSKASRAASKYSDVFLENDAGDVLCAFPLDGAVEDGFSALQPLGMCFFSAERNHSFVVTYGSLMTTMGVAEDIFMLPFEIEKQRHLEELVGHFWRDVNVWAREPELRTSQGFFDAAKKFSVAALSSLPLPKKAAFRKKPIKTVWMELVEFDETGRETRTELARKRLQQENLVASLLESGIEYAWISLSPQMYYGVHAKNPEKRAMFEAGFSRFAKALKAESVRRELPAPKILVGFEIANNLYGEHLPKECAVDLYGVSYPDIPSPCSKLFWQEEVVQPLEAFCGFFAKNKLNEYLSLGGITIDFELYGRKDTGGFSSLMLNDPFLAEAFSKSMGLVAVPKDFIAWVIRERKVQSLIDFASKNVRECASMVKSAVQRLMPRGIISAYAPIVSLDWFLTSFCKVLGSGERSLLLFTFNTAFDRVRSVVERKFGCSVSHSTVLMLSKFCSPQDYALLDRAMDANDGYWFNRWSRFVEPRDQSAWHAIEQPGIEGLDECSAFYAKIASH